MDKLIEIILMSSGLLVPVLVVWAISGLYSLRSGCRCPLTEILYFAVMLFVAGLTVRTVLNNDCCWLIHTASLGVMIVAGVMRRPADASELASVMLPE